MADEKFRISKGGYERVVDKADIDAHYDELKKAGFQIHSGSSLGTYTVSVGDKTDKTPWTQEQYDKNLPKLIEKYGDRVKATPNYSWSDTEYEPGKAKAAQEAQAQPQQAEEPTPQAEPVQEQPQAQPETEGYEENYRPIKLDTETDPNALRRRQQAATDINQNPAGYAQSVASMPTQRERDLYQAAKWREKEQEAREDQAGLNGDERRAAKEEKERAKRIAERYEKAADLSPQYQQEIKSRIESAENIRKQANDAYQSWRTQYDEQLKQNGRYNAWDMPYANTNNTDEQRIFEATQRMLDKAETILERPNSNLGEKGGFKAGAKDTASDPEFWTMGIIGIQDGQTLRKVMEKAATKLESLSDRDLENADLDSVLSPQESALVKAYLAQSGAELMRSHNTAKGYKGGEIAVESAKFMTEMWMTGGLGIREGVRKVFQKGFEKEFKSGVMKGLSKLTGESVSRWATQEGLNLGQRALRGSVDLMHKSVKNLIASGLDAAVAVNFTPSLYANYSKQLANVDEEGKLVGKGETYAANYWDMWKERFTEMGWGEAPGQVIKHAGRQLGITKFVSGLAGEKLATFSKRYAKALRTGKMATQGAFNNVGEYFEELVGAAMDRMAGQKDALVSFFEGENLSEMIAGFAPMIGVQAIGAGINTAAMYKADRRFEKAKLGLQQLASQNFGLEEGAWESFFNAFDTKASRAGSADEIDVTGVEMVRQFEKLNNLILAKDEEVGGVSGLDNQQIRDIIEAEMKLYKAAAERTAVQAAYEDQQADKRQAKRDEIQQSLGGKQFWRDADEETGDPASVLIFETERGPAYSVGGESLSRRERREYERDEDLYPVVFQDGSTGFINGSEITGAQRYTLDEYLDQQVNADQAVKDAASMQEQRTAQVQQLSSMFEIGVASPLNGLVPTDILEDGVIFSDGTEMTWEQVGQALGQPVQTLTEDEAAEAEAGADAAREDENERLEVVINQGLKKKSLIQDGAGKTWNVMKVLPGTIDQETGQAKFLLKDEAGNYQQTELDYNEFIDPDMSEPGEEAPADMATEQPAQAEEAPAEPEYKIPLTKEGAPDFNKMLEENPAAYVSELEKALGEEGRETAKRFIGEKIKAIGKEADEALKKMDTNKVVSLRNRAKQYQDVLDSLEEPVSETAPENNEIPTFDRLLGDGLGFSDIDDYVNNQIERITKIKDALEKPVFDGVHLKEWEQAMDKYRKNMADADALLSHFRGMKALTDRVKAELPGTDIADRPLTKDELEPQNATELAAQMFAHGYYLTIDSYNSELIARGTDATGQTGENRAMIGLFRKKENGGHTIAQAAERLVEMKNEGYAGSQFADEDARDIILDLLSSVRTYQELKDYIANNRREQLSQEENYAYGVMAQEIQDKFGLTVDQYEEQLDELRRSMLVNLLENGGEITNFEENEDNGTVPETETDGILPEEPGGAEPGAPEGPVGGEGAEAAEQADTGEGSEETVDGGSDGAPGILGGPEEGTGAVETGEEVGDMPEEISGEARLDEQGNPIAPDGSLIIEKLESIDDLTDEDFDAPRRTVELPKIPDNLDKAIGADGKPVIIKKNIFEKNRNAHIDLSPDDSRTILRESLYNTNITGQTQPKKRPNYWVAIKTGDPSRIVILEVNEGKDNIEIVGWHYIDEGGIERLERQAEREDGQLLILTSDESEAAEALSTLPSGESESKDTESSEESNTSEEKSEEIAENQEENASESEENVVTSQEEEVQEGPASETTQEEPAVAETPRSLTEQAPLPEGMEPKRAFSFSVAAALENALETGKRPFDSIVALRNLAEACGLTVDKNGSTDELLQELVEDGLVTAARRVIESGNYGGRKSREAYDAIVRLYNLQPTISQRSSNRVQMQQYSTPLPMAFVADMFAYTPGKTESILEPTAGNGMLVFATPAELVHANELDEKRLENLRGQGFREVTDQDGAKPFAGKYDAVIANPPFGSAEAKEYDGISISGLENQIALNALASMKDDGRAAIIVGGNMEYKPNGALKGGKKAFVSYLYDHYNVRGIVDMAGDLYKKQGTTWPTMMVLIDGRRSEEDRAQTKIYPPVKSAAIAKVKDFDELYNTIVSVLESKDKTNGYETLRTQELGLFDSRASSGESSSERPGVEHNENVPDGRNGRGTGTVGGRSSGEDGQDRGEGVQQPQEQSGSDAGRPSDAGVPGENGDQTGPPAPADNAGGSDAAARRVDDGIVPSPGTPGSGVGLAESKPQTPKQPKEERKLTDEKLHYVQHSSAFSLESVAPAAMVEAMDENLSKIEERYGKTTDQFVTDELGYPSVDAMHKALAAEQVDSIAMAIDQMKQGQAMIIGDQTGVGKGRQMAALVRWATLQGKKPIFITQKATLFTDIYRDLVDVGSGDLNPFIFNSVETSKDPDTGATVVGGGVMKDANGTVVYRCPGAGKMAKIFEEGELPDEYDFAVITYSQVNTGDEISAKEAYEAKKKNGSRAAKPKNIRPNPKATFLRKIAKDNYLFLDESHTAAGDSQSGAYLQSLVKDAAGVTFASATFAKRPDTMPLYAIRTAMSKAQLGEGKSLIGIIKRGGVTLQEIMSRALTAAGQMVRRERDMSDVQTDWETITEPATVEKARVNYDKTIVAFNEIIDFQTKYVTPLIESLSSEIALMGSSAEHKKGTEKMGVANIPFASKTYNYTKQLMLALKAEAIVDRVAQEIEAGRHPVIALESTMEGLIKDYQPGETLDNTTFAASLLRGLDTCMQYTVTDEYGEESHAKYSPEQLGPEGEKAYYELRQRIIEATSDVFISPLDAIINGLKARGLRVGELTGRKVCLAQDEAGKYVVRRRTDVDKVKLQSDFNSGALDVLILNKSASTGISLHASKKFKDQRQRSMIIAQPLSDINDYMQMIGRIDRTGQVHRGYYINFALPVPAEQRFNMMLSTKLKSLNANTTTSQDSESSSVDAPDLLNKYGSQVVVEYLRDNPDIYRKLGTPLRGSEGPVGVSQLEEYRSSEDDARKITGYVALLSTKEQQDFYDDVVRRYNELIAYLNESGTNDLKISVLPLEAKTLDKRISSPGVDPTGENPFAQDAFVERVEMNVLSKPMTAEEIQKVIDKLNGGKDGETRKTELISTIQDETQKRLLSEDERYERTLAKTQEEIAKRKAVIRSKEKMTDEEKERAINRISDDLLSKVKEDYEDSKKRIDLTSGAFQRRIDSFDVGKTYLISDNLGSDGGSLFASPAIFCGFKAKPEKITASTTIGVFAPLDGRRRIEVKMSDMTAVNQISELTLMNYDAARQTTLENWDRQIPKETRKEGYILTGNVLQAIADSLDDEGVFAGRLVSFTDDSGTVRDGILMPDKWTPAMLPSSGVPINAKAKEIIAGTPVVSKGGDVKIEPHYGYARKEILYYTLSVPKSKKSGGKFYLDESLLSLVERFWSHAGKMETTVFPAQIQSVLDRLGALGVRVVDDSAPSRMRGLSEVQHGIVDRAEAVARANELATGFGVKLRGNPDLKAKGRFVPSTGTIEINFDQHEDIADVEATVFHEVVAHYGLRKMLGRKFGYFLNDVYAGAHESIRQQIDSIRELIAKEKQARGENPETSLEEATEEYLAELAEDGINGEMEQSLWQRIKQAFFDLLRRAGLNIPLTDEDLMYVLWQSKRNLENTDKLSILELADRALMRDALRKQAESSHNPNPEDNGPFDGGGRRTFSARELAEMETPILESKGTFSNLAEAEIWAKDNLQGRTYRNEYSGEDISIGRKSVKEMLGPKSTMALDINLHLAALQSVPEFIKTGIPAEVHRDTHGGDFDVMRLYNAISINGKVYRVKSTVKRVAQGDRYYTYEIQQMELIEGTENDGVGSLRGTDHMPKSSSINSITGANLLKGVKKTNSDEYILPEPAEPVRYRALRHKPKNERIKREIIRATTMDEENDEALRLYNRAANNVFTRLGESFIDMMNSLTIARDAMVKESGKEMKDSEDFITAFNTQSSRMHAMSQRFADRQLKDLREALKDITDEFEEVELYDISKYVTIKSGLERNVEFAKRDARDWYKEEFRLAVAKVEADDKLSDAEKTAKVSELEQALDQHLKDIEDGTDKKFLEYRKEDYGGISGWMSRYEDETGKPVEELPPMEPYEAEEEYNARIRHMRKPLPGAETLEGAETLADEYVAEFEQKITPARADRLWKAINDCTRHILRTQYKSNLISKAQFDALIDRLKYYVPLRGFEEKTAGDIYTYYRSDDRGNYTPPLLRAGGRMSRPDSPFGYIASMADSAFSEAAKNDSKRALFRFVANRKDNSFATVADSYYRKTGKQNAKGGDIYEAVNAYTEVDPDTGKPYVADDMSMKQQREGFLKFRAAMFADPDVIKGKKALNLRDSVKMITDKQAESHIVRVKVLGEEYEMVFHGNPRMAQAINGELNSDAQDNPQKKVLRFLASMSTSRNPAFWIDNFRRDFITSVVNLEATEDAAYVMRMTGNLKHAFRTIQLYLNGGELKKVKEGSKLSEVQALWNQYVDNGAITGWSVISRHDQVDRQIEDFTKTGRWHGKDESWFVRHAGAVGNWIKRVGDFGEAIEQVIRFATFMTSRQMGRGINRSIRDAKEVTVNFNRKGSGNKITMEEARTLGYSLPNGKWHKLNRVEQFLASMFSTLSPIGRKYILFFNANMQGLYRQVQNFKTGPGKTTAMMAGLTMMGFGYSLLTGLFGGDDDDDKKYFRVSDYNRNHRFAIPAFWDKGTFFLWPIPPEFAPFYEVGNIWADNLLHRRPDQNPVWASLAAMGEMLPVNPMKPETLIPAQVKPVTESIANKNYMGNKFYRDYEWTKGLPGYNKAYDNTWGWLVEASQIANSFSGGDYARKGWADFNPAIAQHLIEGYGGGLFSFIGQVVMTAENAMKGKPYQLRTTPIANRFFLDTDEYMRDSYIKTEYYYFKNIADAVEKELGNRHYNKPDEDYIGVQKLMDSKDFKYYELYNDYKKDINAYGKDINNEPRIDLKRQLMAEQDALMKAFVDECTAVFYSKE